MATGMFSSSTAGKGNGSSPEGTASGQPRASPPMQGGGTGLPAKVQPLSQNSQNTFLPPLGTSPQADSGQGPPVPLCLVEQGFGVNGWVRSLR